MNGKTANDNVNTSKNEARKSRNEHAAVMEESDHDERIPTFDRNHTLQLYTKKRNRFTRYKSIIIAAVSAVVIGLCLGILMLNMFGGLGDKIIGHTTDNSATNATSGPKQAAEEKLTSIEMEPIGAFVLQAGVFSTEANASKWSGKFGKSGFSTMIWKRDHQFFLLAGVAETEQQADVLAAQFADFDIYVKEWSTNKGTKQLTKDGKKWLASVINTWHESLAKVSAQESISGEKWKDVIGQFPEQEKSLVNLYKQLKSSHQYLGKSNLNSDHVFLLELWKQLEKLSIK